MNEADPITLHAEGRITGESALAQLVLGGADPVSLPARIAAAGNPPLAVLATARMDALHRLRRLLDTSGLDHSIAAEGAGTVARIRDGFDRAVGVSAEASVAAYSLGDPVLLQATTGEILSWLRAESLLPRAASVLDFGCGIGRVASALAPHAGSVLALDLSPAMIETARHRNPAPNLRYAVTEGAVPPALDPGGCDLVLAVDSFPYVVLAGEDLADRHVAAFARALRPGGALAMLNLSYRGGTADRADAERWAALHGLTLVQAGSTPFQLWDARAWVWRSDAG